VAELRLAGCRTRPLGGYLKGLGVLRVVARQADIQARGRWREGAFELSSHLDADGLRAFFAESYVPSPVISPWNGGSGFFPKDRSEPLEAIERSTTDRLSPFRAAIDVAREILRRRELTEKPGTAEKPPLLHELRRELPDSALDWLDAAIVLTGSTVAYPPLLGSGGNDGRFDFSNNYANAVVTCVAPEDHVGRARASELLTAALDGASVSLTPLTLAYLHRDTSPVNSPTGESDAIGNPWDLILALEGALAMCAGAARRYGWEIEPRLVAPFSADAVAAGFGSAAADEKAYSELWLPVWDGFSSLGEVELLIREARAQVGRRRARTGLDFVRAAGELGVARGIDGFERYSILERAGQARLAVPAGRIEVGERPPVRALRSLDPWLAQLRQRAGGERTPRTAEAAVAQLDECAFEFAVRPDSARAAAVLVALGAVESSLARSARWAADAGLRPVNGVAVAPWLAAVDDGSPEMAIATAIASATAGRPGPFDVRDYLHGTSRDARGRRVFDPNFRPPVPRGGAPIARLAAIHARRYLDRAAEEEKPGLAFRYGWPADGASRRAFALGRLDDQRILDLATGLSLLDFTGARPTLRTAVDDMPCPALDALTLAWDAETGAGLGARPGWAARLAANRVEGVIGEALSRLRLAGLGPLVSAAELAAGAPSGQRLAAALLSRASRSERTRSARSLGVRMAETTTDEERE
jgi:CRISPR-associated protein Csx17